MITLRLVFFFFLSFFFWIMVFSLDLLCPISGRTVPLQFHNLYTYHCFFFFFFFPFSFYFRAKYYFLINLNFVYVG